MYYRQVPSHRSSKFCFLELSGFKKKPKTKLNPWLVASTDEAPEDMEDGLYGNVMLKFAVKFETARRKKNHLFTKS